MGFLAALLYDCDRSIEEAFELGREEEERRRKGGGMPGSSQAWVPQDGENLFTLPGSDLMSY
jgi:hypothetical protein